MFMKRMCLYGRLSKNACLEKCAYFQILVIWVNKLKRQKDYWLEVKLLHTLKWAMLIKLSINMRKHLAILILNWVYLTRIKLLPALRQIVRYAFVQKMNLTIELYTVIVVTQAFIKAVMGFYNCNKIVA